MVGITKKNITDLIVHPEKITDEQLPLLINLAKEYPFSSLLNTLLAKVYNLSNDVAYHSQLEKAAFTICDRRVLYKYIHRPALIEKIKTVLKEDKSDKKVIQAPIKDDDPQLLELEKNIVSAAINLSIQKEVEANPEKDTTKQDDKYHSSIDLSDHQMPLSSWLNPIGNLSPPSLHQDQIIENFISGKKEQQQNPFFSPLESAKLSIVDSEEFVTETLAEIHVKQGNYPKAIKIYEKLILKFPEKNTFFASRIRFIQEKSNYK